MNKESKYTELTQAETMNRLNYLVQVHKDRDYPLYGVRSLKITLFSHGDLAPVVISMTKAREVIRDTWKRMPRDAERMVENGLFVSAIPTMELHLTNYGTLWLSAHIEREAGPELQAKWDAVQATREEQFPEHYEEE
jgi:hypothetical protein|tara:strand:+ start:583 stop:993 length:411 start_codon:yes stop_codon:yes gene_type:complete